MTNAPTTRETADHAELARLAEAAAKGDWWSDDDVIDHQEVSREDERFIYALTPATVLTLLSEIAALRGEVQNGHEHLEFEVHRADQAERQRDELRKAGEAFLAEHDKANRGLIAQGMPKACAADSPAMASLRQALATQGADQ